MEHIIPLPLNLLFSVFWTKATSTQGLKMDIHMWPLLFFPFQHPHLINNEAMLSPWNTSIISPTYPLFPIISSSPSSLSYLVATFCSFWHYQDLKGKRKAWVSEGWKPWYLADTGKRFSKLTILLWELPSKVLWQCPGWALSNCSSMIWKLSHQQLLLLISPKFLPLAFIF